ncbi:MAG: YchJ family metal-binding protein [Pararobbsia sp.]
MKTPRTAQRASDPADLACPCGGHAATASAPKTSQTQRAIRYRDCCGRFIEDGQIPDTAEQLMRSRYTAYVLEHFNYLRETWDRAHCPADLGAEPGPQWLGLEVRAHHQTDANHASVEFVARYKTGGRAHRLHEVSRFTRGEDGRWRYVDGRVDDA